MDATAHSARRATIVLVAALAAALLVGLTTSAWSPASERASLHKRTHLRATAGVGIRSFAYHPSALSVEEGTKVVFANRDSVAHTATRGGSFSTGKIRPGSSAAIRFGERGVYGYHCAIHPSMRGKVVVH